MPGRTLEEIEYCIHVAKAGAGIRHRALAFYLQEVDARGLHQLRGFRTATQYAAQRFSIARREARDLLAAGRALERARSLHIDELINEVRLARPGEILANVARGTPREAIRLLRQARADATTAGSDRIDRDLAEATLDRLQIDPRGLGPVDRQYLEILRSRGPGGRCAWPGSRPSWAGPRVPWSACTSRTSSAWASPRPRPTAGSQSGREKKGADSCRLGCTLARAWSGTEGGEPPCPCRCPRSWSPGPRPWSSWRAAPRPRRRRPTSC
jgi:hypothetical protein